jgi:hypothetical protein
LETYEENLVVNVVFLLWKGSGYSVVVEEKWRSNNDLYTHFVGHTVAQEVSIVAHKNYNNEKVLINLPWKICFF